MRRNEGHQRSYRAFLVSSAMWPEASKPVIVPAVKRLMNSENKISHSFKDNLQGQDPIPIRRGASAIDCKL